MNPDQIPIFPVLVQAIAMNGGDVTLSAEDIVRYNSGKFVVDMLQLPPNEDGKMVFKFVLREIKDPQCPPSDQLPI